MNKNKANFLLKIVLLFSFVLIVVGLGLSLKESKFFDPITGVRPVVDEDNSISITDNGKDKEPVEDLESNEEVSEPEENTPITGGNSNNTQIPNNSNSNSGGNSSNNSTNIPENNPNPPQNNGNVQVPTPPTIEQENDKLRSYLESTYSIAIRYGAETNGYNVGGMNTVTLTDPYRIQKNLNELSINLSHYPKGFFREFASLNMYLTIYLIDRYSVQNVTGVTDPTSNNVVVSIATAYPFSDSFNHEAYHYMERYIEKKGGNFNSWGTFNPLDFSYGNTNSSLSFDSTNLANSYFVNDYAQTDEDEDRASTFEYMMADNGVSCLGANQPVWQKANYMSQVIDVFFNTVNSNTIEYWERFL